jgi:hypothetical protein
MSLVRTRKRREYLLPSPLARLFNRVFRTSYPDAWNDTALTSVFKGKGSQADLGNYRPIQVQAAIAKLYHMVIRARLNSFAESQGLRAEGQAGFRDGCRTSDHIFILRHLIHQAQRGPAPRRRLFCCFVDFEKTYDGVPRDALMRYLAEVEVGGRMLQTLVGMYWRVRARPKQGAALGEAFDSTCGVRQGDPLSPLLFGIYIDRVEAFLAERAPQVGASVPGLGSPLRVLLYADDLVLMSHDAAGLQTLLDGLHAFCSTHHMRVNVSKTEAVVFGPSRLRGHGGWRYAGTPVPVSRGFKYLGIVLHSTKGVSAAIDRLKLAGCRAIWGMHPRSTALGITDYATRARLYRTLAAPILTYGSEIGGPDAMRTLEAAIHSPLQVLQNDYIRHLGGLRRNVPASTLCAESCLPPLALPWLRARHRFGPGLCSPVAASCALFLLLVANAAQPPPTATPRPPPSATTTPSTLIG